MVDLNKALVDPNSQFQTPAQVVASAELTEREKLEILKRWEYDAREMDVATEENMPADDSALLDEILGALHQLNAGYQARHDAPTKHGG